jgi:ubiquinone/menaquinone biosynthesis C-methylase UbiE
MATVYTLPDFPFTTFPCGSRVLDVGFGRADTMRTLNGAGCRAVGIELKSPRVKAARDAGLTGCRARAERLPFVDGAFDGLVCQVVIPYTDEARAIAEIARVLRPGGVANVSYHALGYALHMHTELDVKRQIYAARTLLNTWVYAASGKRLPGFLGSALYQSRGRLRRYYAEVGLTLVDDAKAPTFLAAPVFIYHKLRKN